MELYIFLSDEEIRAIGRINDRGFARIRGTEDFVLEC